MEDVFVAAQEGRIRIGSGDIDILLRAADILATLADIGEGAAWAGAPPDLIGELAAMAQGTPAPQALVLAEPAGEPGDEPMWDLFRQELRQASLDLERGLHGAVAEPMVEAARTIRGAARLVHLPAPADAACAMERALAAALQSREPLGDDSAGAVRAVLAVLGELLGLGARDALAWQARQAPVLVDLGRRLEGAARLPVGPSQEPEPEPPPPPEPAEAVVRVTAQSLNRLMGLAGESLVQARWLGPFSASLMKLKTQQGRLADLLDALHADPGAVAQLLPEARRQAAACRQALAERLREFDDHAAQAEELNTRLYREAISSRMRPFADGAHGIPRLVRDMARALGKQARLQIDGLATEVDRDILERLEAPLMHLVRNALDHGIEAPEARLAAGKPEAGLIRLDVRHRAGMLALTVSDDGAGIDLGGLRRKVAERGLAAPELAERLGEAELLEFLFLPNFSTASAVTEYSGRGVGLDVVQDTVRKIGGTSRVSTRLGRGTSFHLSLPLTLSVVRAVLADIAGEPYAFPHNRIDRLLRVPRASIRSVENRQFVAVDGENVGLVLAAQLLGLPPAIDSVGDLPVILLSDGTGSYGLIVEAFRGEQDLVVRPLDPRLGKVPNVSAAAILDDGAPALIADTEDMIRLMDSFIQSGTLARAGGGAEQPGKRGKRVLVVDDSITVREAERQILRQAGYEVEVAVDGADGWNKVRAGEFDLVVSDVDMPRMTGFELAKAIRAHEGLKALPLIMVSYKERPEDRQRGLEAGADRYLTKSSFHDDSFLGCVADLIGGA